MNPECQPDPYEVGHSSAPGFLVNDIMLTGSIWVLVILHYISGAIVIIPGHDSWDQHEDGGDNSQEDMAFLRG